MGLLPSIFGSNSKCEAKLKAPKLDGKIATIKKSSTSVSSRDRVDCKVVDNNHFHDIVLRNLSSQPKKVDLTRETSDGCIEFDVSRDNTDRCRVPIDPKYAGQRSDTVVAHPVFINPDPDMPDTGVKECCVNINPNSGSQNSEDIVSEIQFKILSKESPPVWTQKTVRKTITVDL